MMSEQQKIFVIVKHEGEWGDYYTENMGAFLDEEAAQKCLALVKASFAKFDPNEYEAHVHNFVPTFSILALTVGEQAFAAKVLEAISDRQEQIEDGRKFDAEDPF